MAKKELLFSVTAADCRWEYFTAGGNGGQNQNRRHTAARCTHSESGATAESREFNSQPQNKRAAFERMAKTVKFKNWHRLETARRQLNAQSIEKMLNDAVDAAVQPRNLKIETLNDQGKWTEA